MGQSPLATGDLSAARIREVQGASHSFCSRADHVAWTHGTFVAGILVAKRGSQAPAICPGCTLLPIFAETSGNHQMPSADPGELATAIVDSVDASARVINLSAALVHGAAGCGGQACRCRPSSCGTAVGLQ